MKTNAPRSGSEIASTGCVARRTKILLHSQNPGRTAILLFLTLGLPVFTMASEIWTGPSLTFVKPSGTDGTLPANQDRLTPDVWLTRNLTMGLFNAAQETTYERYSSPIGTEWAYGTLANYSSLSYTNWEGWNGHNPPSMVGKDAVLHLISDDIYLSIKFTVWGGRGGAFSYERSTPIPEPSAALLTMLGLAMASPLFRRIAQSIPLDNKRQL